MKSRWPLILLALVVLLGCVGKKATYVPRPERGYLHWLEKQSLAGQTSGLLAEVSNTPRLWQNSGAGGKGSILLKAAPNWLEINPMLLQQGRPIFQLMSEHVGLLPQAGFHGLYLGSTTEKADIWLSGKQGTNQFDADSASFAFSRDFGDEKSFETLVNRCETAGIELGADLLGASTGRGPDFLLQARGAPESSGIYAMLPLERENWDLVPAVPDEWDATELSDMNLAHLAGKGIIPDALACDSFTWNTRSGWAATGEIMGIDGKLRRWLYRFHGDINHPVFLWADPFAHARKIFAAAVILETGLRGHTLVGLHMEPLMGLEAESKGGSLNLSPGLDALNELAMQIHRYGGWALQADPLPDYAIEAVLDGMCDFCRDEETISATLTAINEGNAKSLIDLYERRLTNKMDISRLARGFNGWKLEQKDPNSYLRSSSNPKPNFSGNKAEQKILAGLTFGLPGLAFSDSNFFNNSLTPKSSLSDNTANSPDRNIIANLALARNTHELASGQFMGVIKSDDNKAVGLISKLSAGGYWIVAVNFGLQKTSLAWPLPQAVLKSKDIESGRELDRNQTKAGQILRLELDAQQCRNIVFLK